ncbi:EamA family transporter [Devosia faecipullorum]|uniref:EamA family transporter n=1 Tax=Devosia faecipullorum TaxID=2755039 RepID=UPI00187B8C63|nr:EamA family transporter [Devosia faecipullorum]MBE7731948.1 EamA family transporter [Devosia faecipullorum]
MTLRIFLLILVSVTISALAQVALKRGMAGPIVQRALDGDDLMQKLVAVSLSPMVFLGLALYAMGAVVWLLVLARIDVSQAYPFVGIGFLITLGFGVLVLGEAVTLARVIGIVFVGIGIIFLSRS